ncbi:MAG TPA: hypothetical protein VFN56_02160 [Candidatus Saccharimonadales bacterium]|nr:hypothetical protein [Candidatus Saccharimonadales bacterium]
MTENTHSDTDTATPVDTSREYSKHATWSVRKRVVRAGFLILSIGVVSGIVLFVRMMDTPSPVPKAIQQAVPFPIYYPVQHKLPAGYQLDNSSFHITDPQVVIYSLKDATGQLIIFSEEKSPGSSIIDKFTASAIPLHTTQHTALGQADFGAYNNGQDVRTIVSLPITDGPWLIVTSPQGDSQTDLQHIIEALKR